MKRITILGICITALVAFAAWAPNVLAYTNASSCANCHSFKGPQHDLHTNMFSCSECHLKNGDNPFIADSCSNCHNPIPLQTRHTDNYGASCDTCHTTSPPPPTEQGSVLNDFDGNGTADILLRNMNTGIWRMNLMNDATVSSDTPTALPYGFNMELAGNTDKD